MCLVLVAKTKYIAYLSFPDTEPKPNLVPKVYYMLLESQLKNYALAQWNMIGNQLFDSDSQGSEVIFEISKERFILKPPPSWCADVSIIFKIFELLLKFSILYLHGRRHGEVCFWYHCWKRQSDNQEPLYSQRKGNCEKEVKKQQ